MGEHATGLMKLTRRQLLERARLFESHNTTLIMEGNRPGLWTRLWNKAREICRLDWFEVYETLLGQYYGKLKEKAAKEKGA